MHAIGVEVFVVRGDVAITGRGKRVTARDECFERPAFWGHSSAFFGRSVVRCEMLLVVAQPAFRHADGWVGIDLLVAIKVEANVSGNRHGGYLGDKEDPVDLRAGVFLSEPHADLLPCCATSEDVTALKHLQPHDVGRGRDHTVHLVFEEGENFRTAFGPLVGRGEFRPIGESERIGQSVRCDLRFVVVRRPCGDG